MTITLDKDFFLDQKRMNVFSAALIRTRDIDEAFKATQSKECEPSITTLDAKESADVYRVLCKAVYALGVIAKDFPNEGNTDNLNFAKTVCESFGKKTSIGGYASDEASNEAYMRRIAEDCAKYGCN